LEKECKMKRVLFLGVLCSLLAFPLHATEIFWDETPPSDPTITDKDFSLKYGSFKPAKSLEQMDVYDSGELLKLNYEIEAEKAMTPPTSERSSDVVDLPLSSPPAITRPEPTRRTRSTVAPAQREATPSRVEPAVRPETPVAKPDIPEETRRPVPVPAIAEEPVKTEPKKLQWGQQDTKPLAEPTTKFKWGEKPR
jgi:hypothetical protein